MISTSLSSNTLICFSAYYILLLVPSSEFFILVIVLFISSSFILKSSTSLLNVSYNLLIFEFSFFPNSWIIFTITLKSYFMKIPFHLAVFLACCLIPSSGSYFSAFSFCVAVCVAPFCRLQGCSLSCFWCLPPCG